MLDRFLRGENQAENIQIKLLVEMFVGDVFQRAEFVDARVVHENVELAERLLRFGEQAVNVHLLGNVALHGNGLAARAGDFGDDLVRAGLAGSVIDDDRRAFRREMSGDGSADAFGCARDDGDLACEFFVMFVLIYFVFLFLLWFVDYLLLK